MEPTATVDSTSGTFTLTKGVWTGSFPVADLPKWLAFYRRQRDLFPTHASSYDGDVKALETLAAQLSDEISPRV